MLKDQSVLLLILFILLGAAVLGLLLFIIGKCFFGMRKWSRNEEAELSEMLAVVTDKQSADAKGKLFSHVDVSSFVNESEIRYYVTFRTENGREETFELDEMEYRNLQCGDRGTLIMRGSHYIRFDREETEE